MVNIYVDKKVKDSLLFKAVLSDSNEDFNVVSSLNSFPAEKIDVAVIWLYVPECISEFKNLKLLLVSGSGIDHLLSQKELLKKVPTVRIVDNKLKSNVADYVLNAVKHYQSAVNKNDASNVTVGMMGLGLIGETSVKNLLNNGFKVISWVKSNKPREVKDVYIGDSCLNDFLTKVQVLVCQLPLTSQTKNLLNDALFKKMQKDSYIINVGRGGHLNETDLINNIRNGHLKGACLDVFSEEPLPADSILRKESNIILTPHIAGGIFPKEQAEHAAKVIEIFLATGKAEGMVNYELNY